jgi:tetratricopeptide (TPR) repeat protein
VRKPVRRNPRAASPGEQESETRKLRPETGQLGAIANLGHVNQLGKDGIQVNQPGIYVQQALVTMVPGADADGAPGNGTAGTGSEQEQHAPGISHVSARRVSNLPARNPHFVGRAEELEQLDRMLEPGSAAVVAVHGLGGIGKTELVLEYARIHLKRHAITWWIHASDQVELTADLVRLSHQLGFDAGVNPENAIDSVRSELATRSDWLLIFDNADDPAVIRRFLPSGGEGNVLITSRLRNWTGVARTYPVEELTLQESAEYFRFSTAEDSPSVAELAEELGGLPLALAQAAGYIAVKNCSVARYLELYRLAAQEVLAEGPRPHGYPETVATTWLLHFRSLSAQAVDLLRLVAFLAPDTIPLRVLFDSAPEDSLPGTLQDVVSDPLARETAIGELVSTCLLMRLDDQAFRAHRLVQEITRAGLDKREGAIWSRWAVDLVQAAFPAQPQLEESWSKASLLAPHARVAGMRINPHQKAAGVATRLLEAVALFLIEQEQWETAHETLEHALNLALHADRTRLTEARILHLLAKIDMGRHDYEAAIEKSTKSLNIMENIFGPTHPALIGPLLQIAYCYQGNQQAYLHFDRVAEIVTNTAELPPDVTLSAFMGLGEGMRNVGEYDAAQHNLQQALILANGLYGENSHYAAQVHAFLAWVHHSRGDQETADGELSTAIAIISDLFGTEHPYTCRLVDRRAEWRVTPPL